MKTFYLTTFFLLTINILFGQRDTIISESDSKIITTSTWQGECYDNNGKPFNPGGRMSQVYMVNNFKSKTPIDINIKSIKLGSQTIKLDIRFKDNIEGDTKIINLNDTVGIKLIIAKTVENGAKKYLYKLEVFLKDQESNCWRPLTFSIPYNDVYTQTVSLNFFAIGYTDKPDYFEIVEGWLKFN